MVKRADLEHIWDSLSFSLIFKKIKLLMSAIQDPVINTEIKIQVTGNTIFIKMF